MAPVIPIPIPIPIANLYYLLSYAWNYRLRERDLVAIDADSCPDLNNFLARILIAATRRLLRRGLDRSYLAYEDETSRIRGRIDFSASEKKQTRLRGKLVCTYDELSPDVLHNRIVKATLRLLLSDPRVHADARQELRKTWDAFAEVGDFKVTPHHFHRVQLHRNNEGYRFVLHVCQLIHASLLPEKSANGALRFRDLLRDEKLMATIFQDFVRHFAARHFPEAGVSAMGIQWQASDFGEGAAERLPCMLTDVTMAWPERKLILDCKYYREALQSRYDVLKFHSSHLYQLHAYLTNKGAEPGWEMAEGMLLYPANGYEIDHSFTLHGRHRIRVATINLHQPWPGIEGNLRGLLDGGRRSVLAGEACLGGID